LFLLPFNTLAEIPALSSAGMNASP